MPELNLARYTPKEKLLPSQWAERNVLVPAGNARPGKISFREAPFQRAILDTCVDPTINRLTVMSAAQVGKTMIGLCLMGYHTAHEPMSQVLMQPTQTDMKKFVEGKLEPMVVANPVLQNTYAKPRGREGANNAFMKTFSGGILYLAWAGSTNTMRGISAPIVICDEAEAYESTEEGHPVNLLRQRSETFGEKRKLIEISTPTVTGKSWIEQAYERGDKRRFHVVCPDCEHTHTFEWEHVRYDKEDVSTALIHCPKCGVGFDDTQRISMVRYAEADGAGWIAEKPTRGHASFQLSALYSPLRRLQDIVQNYLDVENDPGKDKSTFYNTCLGLPYESTGESADEHELAERVEDYGVQVPDGVKILTAGTDVQKDRLEVEVAGWGTAEERWNIAYEIFPGDTSDPRDQCYKNWLAFLNKGFVCSDEARMFISGIGIDSGFNALAIYDVVYRHGRKRPSIFALKGVGSFNRDMLKSTKTMLMHNGKVRPPVHTLAVDIMKRVLMSRLNIPRVGAGYCHFPTDRSGTEYFNQLTSEMLILNPKTNRLKWTKKDHDDNEALDCAVYNYATLHILNPDLQSNVRHAYFKSGKPGAKKPTIKSFKNQWA